MCLICGFSFSLREEKRRERGIVSTKPILVSIQEEKHPREESSIPSVSGTRPGILKSRRGLSSLNRRREMVVSSDENYGSDPGLQTPETPDIRSSLANAALFSLVRSQRAQVEVQLAYDFPGAYCIVAQASGSRGAKKLAREIQESVIPSGKRTRTATATFVAAPAEKLKRESRGIVLPRSRFFETSS